MGQSRTSRSWRRFEQSIASCVLGPESCRQPQDAGLDSYWRFSTVSLESNWLFFKYVPVQATLTARLRESLSHDTMPSRPTLIQSTQSVQARSSGCSQASIPANTSAQTTCEFRTNETHNSKQAQVIMNAILRSRQTAARPSGLIAISPISQPGRIQHILYLHQLKNNKVHRHECNCVPAAAPIKITSRWSMHVAVVSSRIKGVQATHACIYISPKCFSAFAIPLSQSSVVT